MIIFNRSPSDFYSILLYFPLKIVGKSLLLTVSINFLILLVLKISSNASVIIETPSLYYLTISEVWLINFVVSKILYITG